MTQGNSRYLQIPTGEKISGRDYCITYHLGGEASSSGMYVKNVGATGWWKEMDRVFVPSDTSDQEALDIVMNSPYLKFHSSACNNNPCICHKFKERE